MSHQAVLPLRLRLKTNNGDRLYFARQGTTPLQLPEHFRERSLHDGYHFVLLIPLLLRTADYLLLFSNVACQFSCSMSFFLSSVSDS